jgi:hypothetical protein
LRPIVATVTLDTYISELRKSCMNSVNASIVEAAALLTGFVLIVAGQAKARASATFAAQIADYGVPRSMTQVLARVISSLELLAGAALAVGALAYQPLRRTGAVLAFLLFGLFLAALLSAFIRGRKIACACFGGSSELETVGIHSIVRTVMLLVIAGIAIIPSHPVRPPALTAFAFAAILAALVALASELARLLGPLRKATASIVRELNAASAASKPAG